MKNRKAISLNRARLLLDQFRSVTFLTAIIFSLIISPAALSHTHASVTGPIASLSADANAIGPTTVDTAQQNSYADVVSRVAPAVVTVRSRGSVRVSRQMNPFFDNPLFRDFFGDRMPRGGGGGGGDQQEPRERVSGLGSGVIVSADGYILTNHHVVDEADEIMVELSDNRTFRAKLIGSDEPSDLAVLKIDASNLPVLPLGDSDKVRVGDAALAIGNPLGIGQTVTSGIISAKGRSTGLGDGSFEDFIQTDAPINRGNSGGALVSASGELIGINSQILSPSGGNIGIGFAIPANMAKDVMNQLIKSGKVRRGMLGVSIQRVTAELAESFNLKNIRGALVNSVNAGSPAERAGIKQGDVIVAFNGTPVADNNALRNLVARTQPGTQATVTVLRDNKEQQLQVTLGELPVETSSTRDGREGSNGDGPTASGKLGISAEPLTPDMISRLGLKQGAQGLLITAVDPNGPAADAGIRRGDIIEQVNRQPVRSIAELRTALQTSGTRPVLLLVNRPNQGTLFLTVRPRQ